MVVGNEGVAGDKLIPGPLEKPVPLNVTVCGEFGASSVIVRRAERTPAACGVNVTVTVQPELTAMAALQVELDEL